MFRGVNMREAQIYIKQLEKRKKLKESVGCRSSTGGVFIPLGGCKISLNTPKTFHTHILFIMVRFRTNKPLTCILRHMRCISSSIERQSNTTTYIVNSIATVAVAILFTTSLFTRLPVNKCLSGSHVQRL